MRAACFVATIGLAACLGAPAAPLSVSDLASRVASTYCRIASRCCQDNGQSPASGCVASMRAQIEAGLAAQMQKGQVYDSAAAGRCATALDGLPDDCSRAAEAVASYDCRVVVDGTLAPGTACTNVATCAQANAAALGGQVLCVENGAGNPAICKALVPVYKTGAPCSVSTSDAGSTLYRCDEASLTCKNSTCAPATEVGLGESCDGVPCQANLICGADARCHLAHPILSVCLGGFCTGQPMCI